MQQVRTDEIEQTNSFYEQTNDLNNYVGDESSGFERDKIETDKFQIDEYETDEVSQSATDLLSQMKALNSNVSYTQAFTNANSFSSANSNLSPTPNPASTSINGKNSKKGRKKALNSNLIENIVNQQESIISFSLGVKEITKLSAIGTLLGYQDLGLFVKEIVVKALDPYIQTASQAIKEQHFNQHNQ